MTRRLTILLLGVLLTAACTSKESGPSEVTLNLTGTWSGDITVQGVTARMSWSLTQSGNSLSGPILIRLPNGTVLVNGTLSGTVTGSTVAFTISVVPGNIPSQPTCSGEIRGTLTATNTTTLTGSYTASSTCVTGIPGGSLTLTKN
jgi:hypothetical protein